MGRRLRLRSLRARLAVAFAAVAVVTAAVIGLVLVAVLSGHDAKAQDAYLATGAERAVRDLAVLDWSDQAAMAGAVDDLAVVTQSRVTVTDTAGATVAVSGPPTTAPAPGGPRPLDEPLGTGLFGLSADPTTLPRSDASITLPVRQQTGGATALLGRVTLDLAPDYRWAALVVFVEAWLLASLVGVLAAALAGLWIATSLARPVAALTTASEQMAAGDLTARAVVHRDDELGRLAGSFNAMAERTQNTVTALRRFVADAAHEVGTPLTALRADLELAEARAEGDDGRRLIRRAIAQADRLGSLAAGLLRLARLEAREAAPLREPVDLTALVLAAADAVASRADQAGLELRVAVPDGPLVVSGDADRLQTAVSSLLDNACKFTPAGGTITLSLHRDGSSARVRVEDSGIGIPAEDLPGLFDRFHRARNATAYPGSGLGLAIVRATAELHGGTVGVASGASGTTFELVLPAG